MVPGSGKDKTSQAGFADGLAQDAHTDRTLSFATLKESTERVFPPGKTLSDMPACQFNTSKEVFKVKDFMDLWVMLNNVHVWSVMGPEVKQ